MPRCLSVAASEVETLLILEDLRTLGFDRRPEIASTREIRTALRWLAWFHALNLDRESEGLWECGSYWHLDTRPDELAALEDLALKAAAAEIDAALKRCPYQTIIHGDAKLANFVFSEDGDRAAAVDFQYVGRGCGMKDVIMLLSSAVPAEACEARCPELLDDYFGCLKTAIAHCNRRRPELGLDFPQLEQAWRSLYCVAWADFQRFVKGWSPGHWKVHAYSEKLTKQTLAQLHATS